MLLFKWHLTQVQAILKLLPSSLGRVLISSTFAVPEKHFTTMISFIQVNALDNISIIKLKQRLRDRATDKQSPLGLN